MSTGALMLPDVMVGTTDASMTRSRLTPRTRSCGSTTAMSSLPMRGSGEVKPVSPVDRM
jgi:hypothetical protein